MIQFIVPSQGTKTPAAMFIVEAALDCAISPTTQEGEPITNTVFEGDAYCVVRDTELAGLTLLNLERLGLVTAIERVIEA